MSGFVAIAGYALPFGQVGRHNGRLEFFDPGAFRDQLARGGGNTFLNFGTHESEPIARPLALFADGYGIGFAIAVSAARWRSIGGAVMRDCQYCSIFATGEQSEFARLQDGTAAYRITRAEIAHVTLCADPCYFGTGVWPRHVDPDESRMPRRLRSLRARWLVGWQRHVEREREKRRPAGSVPPRIAAALAPHAGRFQQFRATMAQYVLATGSVPILGHAAMSRGAGFSADEFMQMIAAGSRQAWKNPGQ